MASTYTMRVANIYVDGTTGHHRMDVTIVEKAGDSTIVGVTETYGIDLASLNSKFGGSIEKWREWVHAEMLKKHLNRMSVHHEMAQWEGKEFSLPSQTVVSEICE